MTSNRDHFDSFAPHTRLKHAVYGYYVQRWARILLSRWDTLRIVDACAGEGADQAGNPGSPLIALKEGEAAARQIAARDGKPKTVELVAIEKVAANFRKLSGLLGAREHVRLENGTLTDVIPSLEPDFARVPHLFFIDPFGLLPLQADVIKRALAGPRNEVFLLFAGQAIRRHFGSVVAAQTTDKQEIDLFAELLPPAEPSEERNEHIVRGAASSQAILDAAYGPMDWRAITALRKKERLGAALDLYVELLRSFGTGQVLPMLVLDSRGQFKYHLVYATKSGRGYEVMKDAMRAGLKQGLVGSEAGMAFGTTTPIREITRMVTAHFAGRTDVPWTAAKELKIDNVRKYALEHTPAMHNQLEALQGELEPYATGGRSNARIYTFPPA